MRGRVIEATKCLRQAAERAAQFARLLLGRGGLVQRGARQPAEEAHAPAVVIGERGGEVSTCRRQDAGEREGGIRPRSVFDNSSLKVEVFGGVCRMRDLQHKAAARSVDAESIVAFGVESLGLADDQVVVPGGDCDRVVIGQRCERDRLLPVELETGDAVHVFSVLICGNGSRNA